MDGSIIGAVMEQAVPRAEEGSLRREKTQAGFGVHPRGRKAFLVKLLSIFSHMGMVGFLPNLNEVAGVKPVFRCALTRWGGVERRR